MHYSQDGCGKTPCILGEEHRPQEMSAQGTGENSFVCPTYAGGATFPIWKKKITKPK